MKGQASFQGIISKVTTLVDGGWRISIDISSNESDEVMKAAKMLMQLVQVGVVKIYG